MNKGGLGLLGGKADSISTLKLTKTPRNKCRLTKI